MQEQSAKLDNNPEAAPPSGQLTDPIDNAKAGDTGNINDSTSQSSDELVEPTMPANATVTGGVTSPGRGRLLGLNLDALPTNNETSSTLPRDSTETGVANEEAVSIQGDTSQAEAEAGSNTDPESPTGPGESMADATAPDGDDTDTNQGRQEHEHEHEHEHGASANANANANGGRPPRPAGTAGTAGNPVFPAAGAVEKSGDFSRGQAAIKSSPAKPPPPSPIQDTKPARKLPRFVTTRPSLPLCLLTY